MQVLAQREETQAGIVGSGSWWTTLLLQRPSSCNHEIDVECWLAHQKHSKVSCVICKFDEREETSKVTVTTESLPTRVSQSSRRHRTCMANVVPSLSVTCDCHVAEDDSILTVVHQ